MDCEFSGCDKLARTTGLCSAHYEQKRSGGVLRPLRVRGNNGSCSFGGCERTATPSGLCRAHRAQKESGRPLTPVRRRSIAKGLFCSFETCSKPVEGNGLCAGHAAQKRRGQPLTELKTFVDSDAVDRWIEEAASAECSECIEWPFRYEVSVPSRVTFRGTRSTPRWHVLALSGRPRPGTDQYALHSCDNERCLNPGHMRWGTLEENMQDAKDRGRMTYLRHEGLVEWLDSQGIEFPDRFRPNNQQN